MPGYSNSINCSGREKERGEIDRKRQREEIKRG
jgi:hypothetical protein